MLDPVLRDDLDHHVKAHEAELIEFRRTLHAHPELGREEHRTTAALVARLVDAGLQPRVLSSGTGVICDVIGSRGERPTRGLSRRHRRAAAQRRQGRALPFAGRRRVPRLRSIYDAIKLASRQRPSTNARTGSRSGSRVLPFDRDQPLPGRPRSAPRDDLLSAIDRTSLPAGSEVLEVPQGCVVLQAVTSDAGERVEIGDPTARFYVLRDRVALSGRDIKDPQQGFNELAAAGRRLQIHERRQGGLPQTSRARSPSAAPELRLPGVDPARGRCSTSPSRSTAD